MHHPDPPFGGWRSSDRSPSVPGTAGGGSVLRGPTPRRSASRSTYRVSTGAPRATSSVLPPRSRLSLGIELRGRHALAVLVSNRAVCAASPSRAVSSVSRALTPRTQLPASAVERREARPEPCRIIELMYLPEATCASTGLSVAVWRLRGFVQSRSNPVRRPGSSGSGRLESGRHLLAVPGKRGPVCSEDAVNDELAVSRGRRANIVGLPHPQKVNLRISVAR